MPLHIDGPPLPKLGPKMKVVRVKTVTPQLFIILSKKLLTVHTHFVGRSKECTLEETRACEHCAAGSGRRYKGYFDTINYSTKERCFLELTPPACAVVELLCEDRPTSRGLILEVSKTKGGPQGRYIVRSTNTSVDLATLPDAIDPLSTLRVLWEWGTDRGQA